MRLRDNITSVGGRDFALFMQPKSEGKGGLRNVTTPEAIRTLQRKLTTLAKQEPVCGGKLLWKLKTGTSTVAPLSDSI